MKLTHFALACLFLLLSAGVYLTIKSDMDERDQERRYETERLLSRLDKIEKNQSSAATATGPSASAPALPAAAPPPAPASDTTNKTLSPATVRVAAKPNAPAVALTATTDDPVAAADATDTTPASNPAESEETMLREIMEKKRLAATDPAADTAPAGPAESSELTGISPKLTRRQQIIVETAAIAKIKDVRPDTGFVVIDRGADANLEKGQEFAVRRGAGIVGRVIIGDTVEKNEAIADIVQKKQYDGFELQKGDELIMYDQTR